MSKRKSFISLKQSWFITFSLGFLILVIVNPVGEFPLNDDWAYSLIVRNWLETGIYEVNDWPAMSLFTQICWGTLFSAIFGFSFMALRLSTLVLAIIGILAFNAILTNLKIPKVTRILALGTLLFNPLYFHLSFTFMTDVPFLTCCLLASFFYLKFFQEERTVIWAGAVFFSICAILIRQLGILIPLAFFIAVITSKHRNYYRTIILAGISVLLTFISLKIYIWCLSQTTGIPAAFSQMESIIDRLNFSFIYPSLVSIEGRYFVYLGIFLLPVLFFRFWRKDYFFLIGLATFGLGTSYLIVTNWDRFRIGNTIYDLGLGPISMPDTVRNVTSFEVLPPLLETLVKVIGVISALLLISHLAKGIQRFYSSFTGLSTPRNIFKRGVLIFVLLYFFFLFIDYHRFDRYLLPLLPFLMMLILVPSIRLRKLNLFLSLGSLLIIVIFSVSGTHDYFSWNRARWAAATYLENQGISPNKIDGGFEYNGWHQTNHKNPHNRYGKSWWFVNEDNYALAFTTYQNYTVKAAFPFHRFCNLSTDTLYALERPKWSQIDTFFYNMESTDSVDYRDDYFDWSHLVHRISQHDNPYSGRNTLLIEGSDEFSLQHRLFPVKPFEQLSVSFYMRGNKGGVGIVNAAPDPEEFHYVHSLNEVKEYRDGWTLITAEMTIPESYPSDTMDVYLWKQQKDLLEVDDWKIIWRRY